MAKNSGSSIASPEDWRIEDDLRTLCQAEKIKIDPKRMKACQELAQKRMVEMASFIGEGQEKE